MIFEAKKTTAADVVLVFGAVTAVAVSVKAIAEAWTEWMKAIAEHRKERGEK